MALRWLVGRGLIRLAGTPCVAGRLGWLGLAPLEWLAGLGWLAGLARLCRLARWPIGPAGQIGRLADRSVPLVLSRYRALLGYDEEAWAG